MLDCTRSTATQAVSDNIVLSDALGYQALNARAAKETLLNRIQVLEDAQNASKAAINKRRTVERLKGSSNISAQKVDDALAEMQDVRWAVTRCARDDRLTSAAPPTSGTGTRLAPRSARPSHLDQSSRGAPAPFAAGARGRRGRARRVCAHQDHVRAADAQGARGAPAGWAGCWAGRGG